MLLLAAMAIACGGQESNEADGEAAIVSTATSNPVTDGFTPVPTKEPETAGFNPVPTKSTAGAEDSEPVYPEHPPVEYSGIVVISMNTKNTELFLVDPETGSFETIASFQPKDPTVVIDGTIINANGSYPLVLRRLFSPGYEYVTANRKSGDGTMQVGWIDRGGYFTDVSALMPATSDFSSSVFDGTPMFGEDGTFYFRSTTGNRTRLMKTTIDDPSNITEVTRLDGGYYVQPDGTIEPREILSANYFENSSGTHGAFFVEDWIDDTTYIYGDDDDSMIYSNEAVRVSGRETVSPFEPDGKELIPETDRSVWSPVASPDGEQIAFLSSESATEVTDIFLVSSNGGAPEKLTNGNLSSDLYLLDWGGIESQLSENGEPTSTPDPRIQTPEAVATVPPNPAFVETAVALACMPTPAERDGVTATATSDTGGLEAVVTLPSQDFTDCEATVIATLD
jgi:hypothetical protein